MTTVAPAVAEASISQPTLALSASQSPDSSRQGARADTRHTRATPPQTAAAADERSEVPHGGSAPSSPNSLHSETVGKELAAGPSTTSTATRPSPRKPSRRVSVPTSEAERSFCVDEHGNSERCSKPQQEDDEDGEGSKDAAAEEPDCCCICLEEYTDDNPMFRGDCQHHFHLPCLYSWKQRSNTCPMCCAQTLRGVGETDGPPAPPATHMEAYDEILAARLQQHYAAQDRRRRRQLQQQQQQQQHQTPSPPPHQRPAASSGARPADTHQQSLPPIQPQHRPRQQGSASRGHQERDRKKKECCVM